MPVWLDKAFTMESLEELLISETGEGQVPEPIGFNKVDPLGALLIPQVTQDSKSPSSSELASSRKLQMSATKKPHSIVFLSLNPKFMTNFAPKVN